MFNLIDWFIFSIVKYTDILVSIRQIIRSINLESKRIEKEHGIIIPQLLCLNYLNEKESFQAAQKEIKEFLQLNANTVTGIINGIGNILSLAVEGVRRAPGHNKLSYVS
ncbi:MAG: hypothetical protein MRZ79_15250 [Bacteroidia bacterium]|nr:hypothetical protein [Bacteroidia bacterium]